MAKTSSPSTPSIAPWPRRLIIIFSLLGPITVAMLIYLDDGFDPAPLPDAGPWPSPSVPVHHRRILPAVEKPGYGILNGPEDLAYDADDRRLYTSCADGWIKRLTLSDVASPETVDDWVYVGGRPLGIAFGPDKELIVAEADKGLMRVSREGVVELLADEAEGVKFRLTDGVDVASDGVIYFTDASSKYSLAEHMLDVMEGRGYGRLMSYDPSTKSTLVLVRGLYFANGVALSPLQDYLLFCQTVLRKCQKYHLQGEKKGTVEDFIDNLPGFPDNIRYDGEGVFWIGIAMVCFIAS
ncbi:yls2-like [Asimina triloba]